MGFNSRKCHSDLIARRSVEANILVAPALEDDAKVRADLGLGLASSGVRLKRTVDNTQCLHRGDTRQGREGVNAGARPEICLRNKLEEC